MEEERGREKKGEKECERMDRERGKKGRGERERETSVKEEEREKVEENYE